MIKPILGRRFDKKSTQWSKQYGTAVASRPIFSSGMALFICVLLCATSRLAAATAPVNDNCSGALVIPGAIPSEGYSTTPVDLTAATVTNELSLTNLLHDQTYVSRGIWYKFTPLLSGPYTISSCSPSTTVDDTVMGIFTSLAGCGGPFTRVDDNDDACGFGGPASITTQLLADTTYYIVVWQYDVVAPPAGHGIVQLIVTREIAPPNDTCDTAIPVTLNIPVAGSTVGATNNYRLAGGDCFTGLGQTPSLAAGRDVVYTFTAQVDGSYSIKAGNYNTASGFNLVLYVAGYCPPGAAPQTVSNCLAAANRNSASSAEEVTCLMLTNGQQIYIYVDDDGTNSGSSFILEVTRCVQEIEPNNSPANATPLACGMTGSISPVNDADFFELGNFPSGWRAFVMVDGEAANVPDFDLRVTSLTDTLEFDDKDNDQMFGQSSPNVAGTPLPGGPVFARVSYNGAAAAEPYRIYGVVQPPLAMAAPETEPNNLTSLANSDSRNYFYGSLAGPAPSADVDVFSFPVSDGDLVFVGLDADPLRNNTPINAKLELLDDFGNVLVTVNDINSGSNTNEDPGSFYSIRPNSPAESLVYRCPAEGTYYVRVSIGTTSSGASGAGDYLLSISRNCTVGSLGERRTPTMTNVTITSPIPEGGVTTLSGTLSDLDIGESLTLIVTWGDGTTNTARYSGGLFPFNFTHPYADDEPSATPSDTYPVHVWVTDSQGNSATSLLSVTVTNVPPRLSNVSVTTPILSGGAATLTGAISDAGLLDSFKLTLNWGDGASPQVFNYPAGTTNFSESHVFNVGNTNFTIQLLLADDDNGTDTGSAVVHVRQQPGAAHFLGITPEADGHMLLQLEGTPESTYRIEMSGNLQTWSELGTAVAGTDGQFQIEDTAPSAQTRFYRAVVVN